MPVTVLAGVHVGCFELFVNEDIHSITDLKGKSVGVNALNSPRICSWRLMAAHVGLDPSKDISWVAEPVGQADASSSSRERSMPSWAFRPSRRNCAPARSAM